MNDDKTIETECSCGGDFNIFTGSDDPKSVAAQKVLLDQMSEKAQQGHVVTGNLTENIEDGTTPKNLDNDLL